MNKSRLLLFFIFIVGFLCGVGFSAWKLSEFTGEKTAMPRETPETAPNLELMSRISSLEKMISAKPDNVEVLLQLGKDYFELGNGQKGLDYFNKALQADPKNIEALTQLGNGYFDLGNHDKAIEYYRKALEIQPNNPNVWTDMGISLRKIGKPQESVAAFRKALENDPNHQLALFNMGIVLRDDLKDENGALAAWDKFLQINPDTPHAVMIRPWVKQLQDKLKKEGSEEPKESGESK